MHKLGFIKKTTWLMECREEQDRMTTYLGATGSQQRLPLPGKQWVGDPRTHPSSMDLYNPRVRRFPLNPLHRGLQSDIRVTCSPRRAITQIHSKSQKPLILGYLGNNDCSPIKGGNQPPLPTSRKGTESRGLGNDDLQSRFHGTSQDKTHLTGIPASHGLYILASTSAPNLWHWDSRWRGRLPCLLFSSLPWCCLQAL